MLKRLFGCSLITAALGLATLPSCTTTDPNGFFAVEYAQSTAVPANLLVSGALPGETVDMSWNFFVVREGARVTLIDVGTTWFEREAAIAGYPNGFYKGYWKVTWHEAVTSSIARLGLRPNDVTDIVFTHKHFDHMEGFVEFPNAVLHVNPLEWADAKTDFASPIYPALGVPTPLPAMQAAEAAGRVKFIVPNEDHRHGDYRIAFTQGSIGVSEAGKHTAHSSVLGVRCPSGVKYIAGDAAYLYRNLEQHVPIAPNQTVDPAGNLRDMNELLALAGGVQNVLPGHDPQMFTRFPYRPAGTTTPVPHVAQLCP